MHKVALLEVAIACTLKLHNYVKFQNQPYKIVPDPNNMDDIKFIKLGIHTVQAEVNAWCQDFKILCRH